jgi:WD40 repeat protein
MTNAITIRVGTKGSHAMTVATAASDATRKSAARVFISYSRRDMAFADRLDAALKVRGFEPLIDRTDIHAFEEWWKRIEELIAWADTVVFILSPDAVRPGSVALREIDFAGSLNKRFAPVVFRPVAHQSIPDALAKLNFVFFDDPARFEQGADQLAEALNTDIGWIRQHTEFGEAARRWALANKPNGMLLRSPVLEQAERWIASRPGDAPVPTDDTRSFILDSRRAATRRRNWLTASLGVGFAVALTLAALAFWQRNAALESQSLFLAKLSLDNVAAGDAGTGLLLALAGLPLWPSGYDRPTVPETIRSLNDSLFSLREAMVFSGHSADVNTVMFDLSGSTLLTSSDDHTARLWDARTGDLRHVLAGHNGEVSQAIFSGDGGSVATASNDGTVKIWDSGTGALLRTLAGHTAPVRSIRFASDGSRLVTGSADHTARIWPLAGSAPPTVLRGHGGPVNSAVFSPSGRSVLTTSNDGTGIVWDADSGNAVIELKAHTDQVTGGEFNADGSLIVTFSRDNTARLWDARSGQEGRILQHNDWVRSATFCTAGNCVVTASDDKTARVWDTQSDAAETVLAHADAVRKAAVSPRGDMIATASHDGSITIWGAGTGHDFKKLLFMSGHQTGLLDVAFDPSGEFVATSARHHDTLTGPRDATARIWRISGPTSATAVIQEPAPIRSSAVSSAGNLAATGLASGTLALWDVGTQMKIAEVNAHAGGINAVAFSSDGTRIMTASDDGTAAVWEVPGLSLRRRLERRSKAVSDASFDRRGDRAVVGSYDGSVTIWNLTTGEAKELVRYPGEIVAAKFAPRSDIVLIAALNETAKLHDATSGQVIRELPDQRGAIRHAAFSIDNERVVTSGEDGRVIVWNASTGEKLDQFTFDDSAVFSDLSDSEEYLVTAAARRIILYRRGDAAPAAIYNGHLQFVSSVHFIPKSHKLLSVAADGSLQIWELKTHYSELLPFARTLAPRCLSMAQLKRFGVRSGVNAWCSRRQLEAVE